MNTKHTPGEWIAHIAREDGGFRGIVIRNETGEDILWYSPESPRYVADQVHANILLCAASKELLKALERMTEVMVGMCRTSKASPSDIPEIVSARAAIAKARGGV